MSIIGIDLGTAGATVATIKKGAVDVILNEASKRISPALVSFHNGQRYLGEPAASLEASNAKNTIRDMKRFIGKQWSDPEVQRDIARVANKERFKELPGDQIGVEVTHDGQNMVFDIKSVLAMQLGGLKRTAEKSLKENQGTIAQMRDVVISVPPYYTDAQRRGVLDSARIAGLNVLRVMNDSAAVALDYGMWKNARNLFDETKPTHAMFMDIGYADTWVSVVAFVKGKATVLSCAWDRELGGRDVDAALVELLAAEFQAKTKMDPRKDVKAMLKLRGAAEKAKQVLTPEGVTKAEVYVEYLMNETDLRTSITFEQLDATVQPLAGRIAPMVKRALADANLSATDIGAVELIGGSSRMRQFKKAMAVAMGLDATKPPNYGVLTTLNADETVARGCALMCALLSPQFRIAAQLEVKEFVPLPIKVQWEQPQAAPPNAAAGNADEAGEDAVATGNSLGLLKRTDDTPKLRRVTFRRTEAFEIVATYDDPIDDALLASKVNRTIGKFKISGMPQNSSGGKIAVTFSHDKNGVFGVSSAQLHVEETVGDAPKEGSEKKDEKPKKKLVRTDLVVSSVTASASEDEIERLMRAENELAAKDKALKDRADKRNELEEFIYAARTDIDERLRPYATDEEATNLKTKLDEDENWLYTDEGEAATFQQLSAHLSALHTIYDAVQNRLLEIEARQQSAERMSQQIQQYLSVANSTADEYAHITDEERKKVRASCDEALNWLTSQQEKQGKLPLNKDPQLTASGIDDKGHKLRQEVRPIVEKPKPKPAATAAPADDKAKTNGDAPKENKDEKMDVEGEEGTKKEGNGKDAKEKMDVEEL